MVVLLIVGHFMGLPLLSHPMIFYILYVWSRKWDPSALPSKSPLIFFHNVESLTLWAYFLLNFFHKFYLSILFLDNLLPHSNINLFKDSTRSQSVSSVSNLLAFICLGSVSVLCICLARDLKRKSISIIWQFWSCIFRQGHDGLFSPHREKVYAYPSSPKKWSGRTLFTTILKIPVISFLPNYIVWSANWWVLSAGMFSTSSWRYALSFYFWKRFLWGL